MAVREVVTGREEQERRSEGISEESEQASE